MEQYETGAERYLTELGRVLPAPEKEKDTFLERMAENIINYEVEAGIAADYDRLVDYFGTPETVAEAYAVAWEEERKVAVAAAADNPWKKVASWACGILLIISIACILYNFAILVSTYAHFYAIMRCR